MPPKADTPRAIVLAVAAVLAGLLVPGLPIVALPIAAMSVAYLWVSGRRVLAVASIALAAALIGAVDLPTAAVVGLTMIAAGPLAVAALRRRSPLVVASALTVVVFAAIVGAQAVAASMAGSTLGAEIARSAAETLRLVASSLGESARGVELDRLRQLLIETWPATNLQICAVAALLAVAGSAVGAQRGGESVRRFPPLAALDLGVHVLWLPVVSVVALAAARLTGAGWLEVVALNALLVSRVPLALQGMGVFGATYQRMGLWRGGRGVGYALAVFVELTTYAVSLVGLVDFWANFRRLPRDGAPQAPLPLEEQGSSR